MHYQIKYQVPNNLARKSFNHVIKLIKINNIFFSNFLLYFFFSNTHYEKKTIILRESSMTDYALMRNEAAELSYLISDYFNFN